MNKVMVADSAISSGMAFLVGELEKLDPVIRQPLGDVSYARDVRIKTGDGGWYERLSTYNVEYGVSGGIKNLQGGVQNAIARIQANLSKDSIKTNLFQSSLSVKWVDLQMQKMTGRDLEKMLEDGTRLVYDRYLEQAVYKGFPDQEVYGLFNNPNIVASAVAQNAGGTSTQWRDKTPQEIIKDIDDAIVASWTASEYDVSAIPNHILISPSNFSLLNSTAMVVDGVGVNCSILNYLLNNNMAKANGVDLKIYPCRHCIGAGTNGAERMVVYNDNPRFVDFQIPVALQRAMTAWNVNTVSMDTLYVSLVGSTRIHYNQPFLYKDGI